MPVVAAATMILIGQRMPTLLMTLGLCVSGLLFRQFRLPVVLTIAVSIVVLALLPVLSPPTFAKLVLHFSDQMQHFWSTPYAFILGRAVTMIQAHPWFGLGWDGYRDGCLQPAYLQRCAVAAGHRPGQPLGCNIHPHNYWLQVGTSAGLPGILLFAALAFAWLRRIRDAAGTSQQHQPDWTSPAHEVARSNNQVERADLSGQPGNALINDRRAGLLIIVFVALWPIASATSLFTVPNAGWVFLMVGWGLAEAAGPQPIRLRRPGPDAA